MWSCSPSANVTCPDIDGFYDRRAAPFQLSNVIKERPEKAKELFDNVSPASPRGLLPATRGGLRNPMLQDRSKYPRIPVSRLSKMMTLSLNRAFQAKGFSITNEQEIILRTLRNYGKKSQTELAAYTGQDRNNLSRTIALLENEGYVIKESSESDRGFCEISISPEGENVHEQLWQILEEWRMNVFKGIEPEELEQFSRTAEKYMKNIDELLGTREGASADG